MVLLPPRTIEPGSGFAAGRRFLLIITIMYPNMGIIGEPTMISRIWHGWTTHENADAYENLLREEIFAGIASRMTGGYQGIHLLRRDAGDEVEFVTIMWFDSMDAVKAFAGEDYETEVVPPKARLLLSRTSGRSTHYEVVEKPS